LKLEIFKTTNRVYSKGYIFKTISLQFYKNLKSTMKLPKGFGKNYFTLRAITATVNQVSLHANASRVQSFHLQNFQSSELEAEVEEEDPATLCPLQLSFKPCHCNCYFFKKTRKILHLFPNQNFFQSYFKSLNNAISPPYFHMTSYLSRKCDFSRT